jgi:hypothetical protein
LKNKRVEAAKGCRVSQRFSGRTAAHALHLLQSSLVYVNTRMVQSVLRNPDVVARLSPEGYRGLSPLIYLHINPYGRFEVDLDKRIDFEQMAA